MNRIMTMGCVVFCSVSCGSTTRVAEAVIDANAQSKEARHAEHEKAAQDMLEQHELTVMTPEAIKRIVFQEWLDHQQNAWVPVTVLSELAVAWPRSASAKRLTITQRDVTILAKTSAGAQALHDVLHGSSWVQNVAVKDTTVTGKVASVKRSLAPETDADVSAEFQRRSDTFELGSSTTVADRNTMNRDTESDAFNCWHRVTIKTDRFQRLDGTWSEGGTSEVRPETPTIAMGQWTESPNTQLGRAWTRNRAAVQLRGPFPALVKGLDCAMSTGVRYSVHTIDFTTDPSSARNAVLQLDVDLITESAWNAERTTPWGDAVPWGDADSPKRSQTLTEQTLADPFAN